MLPKTSLIVLSAPFTVASYMIEGSSIKDLKTTKNDGSTPKLLKPFWSVNKITIDYLEQQVWLVPKLYKFWYWINHLDWTACEAYCATIVGQIVSELRQRGITVPITFLETNQRFLITPQNGVNAISIDWIWFKSHWCWFRPQHRIARESGSIHVHGQNRWL